MQISYTWLKEFFDAGADVPSADEAAELLTFGAFEIEGVETVGNDTVIDVDVLPNRAHDCLCHRGIACEIAALGNIDGFLDPLTSKPDLSKRSKKLEVTIEDPKRCSTYIAARIESVKVGPSPEWLRERLEAIGQRSINNIVDATNYVMFHLGQPMHAFDADKLGEPEGMQNITVRAAKDGEHITLLGETEERTLTEEMTVITDGKLDQPIAIAGIKGGTVAEVSDTTTNIILESANFDPKLTRRTSQELSLRTDASRRFENELAEQLAYYGAQRAAELIVELAGGELEGYAGSNAFDTDLRRVKMNIERTNALLGTVLVSGDIERVLSQLGFSYDARDEGMFSVTVPFERLDIVIEEDLIEEIGRVYGYHNIEAELLPAASSPIITNDRYATAERIREELMNREWTEIYTYTLRSDGDVELANTLAADKGTLRKDLTLGMQEALAQNEKYGPLLDGSVLALFEIGNVFLKDKEVTRLALGVRPLSAGKQEKQQAQVSLASAAEVLEGMLGSAFVRTGEVDGVVEYELKSDELVAGDEYPEVPLVAPGVRYEPLSVYPFVLRDIAFWTPEGTNAEEAEDLIRGECGELLVKSELFDEFSKDGRTSYAFHLVFQSPKKTLSDGEVNAVMEGVEETLKKRQFEVR